MKRFLALVAVIIVATTTMAAGAPPPSEERAPLNHNPAVNCTQTQQDISSGFLWERKKTNISGVSIDVIARALEPCWNGDSTHKSKSFVGLISIQGDDDAGNFNFPQMSICKFRYVEDQTRFCYVRPEDHGSARTLNKVDFPSLLQSAPIGGHRYRLSIQNVNVNGTWKWRYNITDVTLGDVVVQFDIPFTNNGGGLYGTINGKAWWGCETGSHANALGTLAGNSKAYMDRAGYQYGTSSTWYYTQNSNVHGGNWVAKETASGYYPDQEFSQTQNGMYNTDRVACWTN